MAYKGLVVRRNDIDSSFFRDNGGDIAGKPIDVIYEGNGALPFGDVFVVSSPTNKRSEELYK